MHAAVGTDDEAHFNFESRFDGNQQRTGCGQRFRRLGIFAARARAHMWDVAELSGASGSLENLMFALGNVWSPGRADIVQDRVEVRK